MSATPGNDFLAAKTDAELQFMGQNPSYYHPDLVQKARRELQRRGVALAETAPAPAEFPDSFDAAPAARPWLWPAVGGGLVVLALGVFALRTSPATTAPKPKPAPPAELVAVETHVMPSFEAQTESQLRTMPRALPPNERADTTATRKYLLLARRFWEAENQSAYLYEQALARKTGPTLPGQVETTLDKWHRLTSALVYDHKLRPGMLARLEVMSQTAHVRMQSLASMKGRQEMGEFPLDDNLVFLNDSVQYMRQILLGVPLARRHRPVLRHQDFSAHLPDVLAVKTLPAARPMHNPLYVVDGHPLPSDPSTGEAPEAIRALPPDSIVDIVVLKEKAAVSLYGPRAHDGAVVITTRHPEPRRRSHWVKHEIRIF